MIPLGFSIGLTVRMGTVISYDAVKAKRMAGWTMLLTATLGATISCSLHFFQLPIIGLFTKDPEVVVETQAIWGKVCYYVFVLYVFGINGAILRGKFYSSQLKSHALLTLLLTLALFIIAALGLQWRMAAIILVSLWFFTLPSLLWFAVHKEGRLNAMWTILPICYTLMQVLLVASYATVDWGKRSKSIRDGMRRSLEEANGRRPTEASQLLSNDGN